MRLIGLIITAVVGCGSPPAPAPAPPAAPAAMVARPTTTDLEVARVDGRPIWSQCITDQVARGARTARAALDECIAFELLAGAAAARGLATAPTTIDDTRRALVSRLIAVDFEPMVADPQALRDDIDRALDAALGGAQTTRELRTPFSARVYVGSNDDAYAERARATVDEIYQALANERGLFVEHVVTTAERIAKARGMQLEFSRLPPYTGQRWWPEFVAALNTIPEAGRISSPFRTERGWDLILLVDLRPARTRSELEPAALHEVRMKRFAAWTNRLASALAIETHPDVLDRRGRE